MLASHNRSKKAMFSIIVAIFFVKKKKTKNNMSKNDKN